MAVSTIDGTIEHAELGRRAAGVQMFKRITFRLPDGGTRSLGKTVVHADLAERMRPGASGRFYLFTAIDHRGVHGFRDDQGAATHAFPRNNERLIAIIVALMGLWVGFAFWMFGDAPLLPTLLVLFGIPFFFLYRKTRREAEAQFAADSGSAPAAAPEPALGA